MKNTLCQFSFGGKTGLDCRRKAEDPNRVFVSLGKKEVSFDLDSAREIAYLLLELTKTKAEDL